MLPEHEGFRYLMSVCLSKEADVDFSVLIPFSFLSCVYKEDALSKHGALFTRKLQWGFEIAKMTDCTQQFKDSGLITLLISAW